jgi:hypothetical protein
VAVYSTLLYAGYPGDVPFNLGPFEQTCVVRDVQIQSYNQDDFGALQDADYNARLYLVTAGADAMGYFSAHWQGRSVIEPGEVLNAYCSNLYTFMTVSGYLLS